MKTRRLGRWCVLAVVALAVAAAPLRADVRLPEVFSTHMMLQRDQAVPVWGWAAAGEKVTVKFAGQEKTATPGRFGRWEVRLDKLAASAEPRVLEVAGNNTLRIQDVIVGDVWICSGQSNMEWSLNGSMNAPAEIAAAKYPAIRLLNVPGHTTAPAPRAEAPGRWQVCSPQSIPHFSAVGYFFGRRLHKEAGVPIGLIGSNWGGTRIEPWTPPVGFRAVPQLKALADQVNRTDYTVPAGRPAWDAYFKNLEQWIPAARTAVDAGAPLPTQPGEPGPHHGHEPVAIYNAMIHPLVPYGIKGAIWYQGESNGGEGESYFHKMQALILGWRKVWGHELSFYFVQLANWQNPNDNPAGGDGWAKLREAQVKGLTIPRTGMAVIIDIGDARDIHPRDKQDVGSRLAQWALQQDYGKAIVPSGPLYKSHKVEGKTIRITFDHVGKGLMVGKKDGLKPTAQVMAKAKEGAAPAQMVPETKLQRFAIAGKDQKWQWANAVIDGDTVVVSCDAVTEPVAVRYAFSMNPVGADLYNKEGLPASPFRTDAW